MNNLKSLLKNNWINKNIDERRVLYLSQKFNFSIFLSKLICSLNLDDNDIDQFINPNIENFIPDPFKLKDMKSAVERSVKAINNNEKIGILAQEVREVFPALVSEDENEMLSVNYQGLVPVLINAVKEQEDKISRLEKLVEQLISEK